MLTLFVWIVLCGFLVSTIFSIVQYSIALQTLAKSVDFTATHPGEPDPYHLLSGYHINTYNPFMRFWGFFYYNNNIFFQDRDDIFRDWFSINFMVSTNSPYLVGESSYPPLVLAFAKIFTAMADYSGGIPAAQDSLAGGLSLVFFYIVCVVPTVWLIFKACTRANLSRKMKWLLSVAFLVSVPFLFVFDRGNYVLLAIPFTFAFVLWYNDETLWKSELACICLAVAVGIKLYPAAFALLLLKEKKFFAFARTVFYSMLAVLVPFFCFDGGLDNVAAFLYWLLDFSGNKGGVASSVVYGISYSYSPYNLIAIFAAIAGEGVIDLEIAETAITVEKIGKLLTLLSIVLVLFTGLTANKSWKIMLSATIATLFVPSISFVYSSVMMLFPVLFFLLDQNKTKRDWTYFVLFLVVLVPLPTPNVVDHMRLAFRWGVSIKHILEYLAYFVMLFFLTIDCVNGLILSKKNKKISRISSVA